LATVLNHPQLPFAAFEHQLSWLPRQRCCKQRGQHSQHGNPQRVMELIVWAMEAGPTESPLRNSFKE
jgi:hypothetical protein